MLNCNLILKFFHLFQFYCILSFIMPVVSCYLQFKVYIVYTIQIHAITYTIHILYSISLFNQKIRKTITKKSYYKSNCLEIYLREKIVEEVKKMTAFPICYIMELL